MSNSDEDSEIIPEVKPRHNILKSCGLEICILFYGVANSTSQITVQNFYIDRLCRVTNNFSLEECRNITSGFYESDEKTLEKIAAEYTIYQSLIEYGFPIILSFFIGPWTDKNGSKSVLTVSLLGYFLSSLLYVIFARLPNISPTIILTSSIPLALGGGVISLLISSMSLVTRSAGIKERSFRLAVFSVCFDGGSAIGYFIAQQVYRLFGYTHVFITVSTLHGLAVICAIFFVSERKPEQSMPMTTSKCSSQCLTIFDIGAVKETLRTCFKRRQNKRRRTILLLTLCIALQLLAWMVRKTMYLYSRNKFQWTFEDFSSFSIADSLFNNIGGVLMTLVAIKFLHISDIYLGFITVTSNLAGYLVMIFASSGWLMYLGSGIQMLGALTTAVMRSILSKCVDPEEHGKLFSFVVCVELAMPFVAGSVYGLVYMNTVSVLPNAIFILPIVLQVILGLSYLYLNRTVRNLSSYSTLRDETAPGEIIS